MQIFRPLAAASLVSPNNIADRETDRTCFELARTRSVKETDEEGVWQEYGRMKTCPMNADFQTLYRYISCLPNDLADHLTALICLEPARTRSVKQTEEEGVWPEYGRMKTFPNNVIAAWTE